MGVKMSYMGGIRWGGGGHLSGGPPCQDQGIPSFVNNLIVNLVVILFGGLKNYPYLCGVTFLIGGDRVDSSLPYIFI